MCLCSWKTLVFIIFFPGFGVNEMTSEWGVLPCVSYHNLDRMPSLNLCYQFSLISFKCECQGFIWACSFLFRNSWLWFHIAGGEDYLGYLVSQLLVLGCQRNDFTSAAECVCRIEYDSPFLTVTVICKKQKQKQKPATPSFQIMAMCGVFSISARVC